MAFGEGPKVGKEVNRATVCGDMSQADGPARMEVLVWEEAKGV